MHPVTPSDPARYDSALERYVATVFGHEGQPAELEPPGFPPRTVGDVMTRDVVAVDPDTSFQQVAAALDRARIHLVPVVAADAGVIGVVTTTDLLARLDRPTSLGARVSHRSERHRKQHARSARELMTSPAVTVAPTTTIAQAAALMVHRRVRTLPVVDPEGLLVGVVARLDLVRQFLRDDADIERAVRLDVVNSAATPSHRDVRVSVSAGVVTLAGAVETARHARALADAAATVPGVIEVHNLLQYEARPSFPGTPLY